MSFTATSQLDVPDYLLFKADSAAARFGFETAVVVCGKVVNQDASLGQMHTTPGVADVRAQH